MAAVGSVDIEAVLIAWLKDRLPGVVVRAELDNNLANELPTVQIERAAGDDDGFRMDRALVDINVYGATRSDASTLSAIVRGLLLTELRGSTTGDAVFGQIATVSAPSWRPYENTGMRRLGAMYEIYSHPVS
jgi:hypothetical protein